jgi:hypothetical protein
MPPVQVTDLLCFPGRLRTHATWESIGKVQSLVGHDSCDLGVMTPRQAMILNYLDDVFQPWNALDDATMYAEYGDTYPREHEYYRLKTLEKLGELRAMLGADAYYSGQMPEPIPRGLFERAED